MNSKTAWHTEKPHLKIMIAVITYKSFLEYET